MPLPHPRGGSSWSALSPGAILVVFTVAFLLTGCSGANSNPGVPPPTNSAGMATVSLSDPPSCAFPHGSYSHVFITVTSVQAHTSATADNSSPGWQELAPQLASQPLQVDLLSTVQTNCVLAQLGSAQLPAGIYQQLRLLLLSNAPSAGTALPATNACAGNGFNCVVLSDGTMHQLALSSQDTAGLKIPLGQIVGGPIQVASGQSVTINIDFNACASVIRQGNGTYRLKPTLTAGQLSANSSGISGQVVDSITKAPISGPVLVAIERTDSTGIDRILMDTSADANGNFRFCPLPAGVFDIVVVALGPNNLPYNATAVLNVPNGSSLAAVPLVPETGASEPAILQGTVTATTGMVPAAVDVSLAALQPISPAGGTTRQLSVPLETAQATPTTPSASSTNPLSVSSNANCPVSSPANSNCGRYVLVVPGSNPSVGIFSASGFSFVAPASGDVLFSIDAEAAKAMSGGVASCSPSEQVMSKDTLGLPLKAVAGATTLVSRMDFSACN